MKTCSKCLKLKDFNCFSPRKGRKFNLNSSCKECGCKSKKDYYYRNSERCKAYSVFYREHNKQKTNEYNKKYYKKNRLERLRYINEYTKNREKVDVNFKMRRRLRSRLYKALKNNQKVGSAVKDLGMSIDNFKDYIERLWQPGMSWDNYGTSWHIDHIFPLSKADLTCKYQLRAVCHFTNLQPLWAEDNRIKGVTAGETAVYTRRRIKSNYTQTGIK